MTSGNMIASNKYGFLFSVSKDKSLIYSIETENLW